MSTYDQARGLPTMGRCGMAARRQAAFPLERVSYAERSRPGRAGRLVSLGEVSAGVQAKVTWASALAEAGCLAFLEATASQAVDRALALCPEAEALLGDGALDDLRRLCLSRLADVYERPLVQLALRGAGLAESLSLQMGGEGRAHAMHTLAEGVRDELAAGADEALRERLTLAPAYELAIARNFSKATSEFLARLLHHRGDVSAALLGGRPITRVEGVSAKGADPHRQGRLVMRVDTDAGSFFYKPHDCRVDGLYGELIGTWQPGCARAAALVQGEGFAFVERLVPREPAGEEGLRLYWGNLGRLTALLHGLGSRDITCDNLMCCGELPAVLDLETLLVGEVRFDGEMPVGDPAAGGLSARELADSAACTAVLPLRVGGRIVSPLVADNASGTCLPRMGGVPVTVRGFERDFSGGFEEGYRHLMGHRDEVLELLGRHGEAVCRQILLNTQAYAQARGLLFGPQALHDPSRRDAVLAELNEGYDVFPAELRRAVAEPDAAALAEGDIPYYCSRVGSRILFAGDDRPLGELLARSPLEVAASRLARLSEDELRLELDLIGRCLAAVPSKGGRP